MSWGINIENDVLNQKGSPAIYSDTLANRPAAGYAGRLFIGTDNLIIYRDTGSAWVAISGGGVIGADNGTTLTSGVVELGGNLIKNTSIGGAFTLSFTAATGFGFGTSGSTTHMGYFLRNSNTVPNGSAAMLGVNQFTPQSTLATTNFYGTVGTLNLNLSTSNLTGASTFNAAGLFGSVVVAGNNGSSSSRALRAIQGGFVINGNVLLDDIRALAARTPEVSGTNTIVNSYGCYIDTQKVTGVTNGWGVYQVASTDVNFFGGEIRPDTAVAIKWNGRSQITSPGDGSILLRNNAGTGFDFLYFGGTTSAFPMLKRSAQSLNLLLGDNSGWTSIQASNFWAQISLKTSSTGQHTFSSNSDAAATADTGIARSAAGIVRITNGSTGTGFILIGASTDSLNGAAALQITSTTRGLVLSAMTADQASVITPVDGLIVNVNTTDATFTSVGLWGYQGGAWAKL